MDVQMPDGTIVTGVPDDITQKDLMSRYQNYQPPAAQSREGIRSVLPETSNPVYGLISRGAGIVGSGLEAVQRAGDYLATGVASALPFTSFTREQAEQVSRPQFVGRAAEATKAYSEGINYAPSTTLGELGDNPLKVIPFIAERIITSTPDMAAAVFAAPAYITARTNEILNERLKNDEKELKDATVSDVAASLVGAVIEQKLESFATKGLFKGRKLTGKNAGTRILKEMGVQSGTEGLEEAAANIAGSLGTKRGVDPRELGENVLEGMIVGAGLGGGVRGTQEYLQSRKKPEEDFTEPKTIIDPETGIKRVYSYTPIDDPSLELGGTPDINGRKTYIYREKRLETEQETTEIAPPAAPPATIPAAPPVTPPVAPASQEGVPSDVGVDQTAMEEEWRRSQGQLPLASSATPPVAPVEAAPASEPVAQPAQVAQTEDVQVNPPGELVSTPPASPVAQPAQIAQPENVQPTAEDIVQLDDKGEPIEAPQSIAEPKTEGGQDVSQADAPKIAESEESVAPVFSEDIPNERWLKGKVDYAIEKGRNRYGVPHMSTITGSFDKPVEIPLSVLTKLKGEADEQNNVRQKSLEYIRNNWDEVSKSPPYIEVAYNGEAYVSEGNHRIMVAAEKGLKSLPVEIRYFDGGQRNDGPLKPSKIEFFKKEEGLTSPSEKDLSEEQDVVSTPVQISPEQQKIDALNKFEQKLLKPIPPFRAISASGTSVLRPKPLNAGQIALIKDLAGELIDLGMPASVLENVSAAGATRMGSVAAISESGWLILGKYWPSRSRAEHLQTVAHELGHSVDNTQIRGTDAGISNGDAWQKAHDELKKWYDSSGAIKSHPLSYPFSAKFNGKVRLKDESFAQAFSFYFVSPVELQTNAPEAYSQIQSIVEGIQNESQRTGATSATKTGAAGVQVQPSRSSESAAVQSDTSAVGSGVSQAKRIEDRNDQNINAIMSGAKPAATWQSLEPMTWKDTRAIQLFDKHRNLDLVQKEITKIAGEISNDLDAYRAETLAHGRAERQVKDFLTGELRPIIKEMKDNNVTDDGLTEYLVMRHAKEANDLIAERNPNDPTKQDKGSGVSYKQREDYFKALDPDKKKAFESIAKKVDGILKKTRDLLEEGGVITKEQRDAWESLFEFYVPLRREESDYSLPSSSYRRVGDYAKSRTGSAKDVIDVLSNVASAREIAINRIEKEKVNRAVYGLAVMNPNPEFWMAISPDAIKNKDVLIAELEDKFDLSKQDAEAFVKNIMAEPTKERFNKETGVVDRYIDTTAKYADYVLPVKIDGKDRFVFFNPKNDRSMQMVQSLRGLDVPQLGSVMQMVAPVTRFFSAINTQYNLIFGAWNFVRDVQGARLNLSTTPIADEKNAVFSGTFSAIPDIYKAVREQNADKPFSDTGDGSWDDFTTHGGKVGYKDQFAKLNQSTNIVNRELATLDRGMTMRGAYNVLNYISNLNDVLENATRLSAYRVALDKFKKEAEAKDPGGKITQKQLDAMKARAADIAKNITVNFNRKGTWGVTAGSLYAFFNASAQGTKRLYETLSGPKGKTIMAAGIGIGIAQAIALAMAGFDEDEPTEFIKQKNLVIPTGDGKYVMWPMPFGFNVFPNLGRIFFETASKASKGQSVTPQLANTVTMLANAFNPLGGGGLLQMVTPTVGDPIVALIENKDAFGRPISRESRATSPEPGYKLSRDPSPSISQFLAEFINTITFGNKDKRGFLSPTADQMDYLGKQLGGGVYRETSGILTYVSNEIQDKETPDYKVPIVGKIVGDLNSPPAISQRFYSNVIKMAEHEKAIKGRIDRRESVTAYMRENPEASLWRRANTLENEISKLNKRRREMVEKQEPVERIKQIDDQKTRRMKKFNDDVRKYN